MYFEYGEKEIAGAAVTRSCLKDKNRTFMKPHYNNE